MDLDYSKLFRELPTAQASKDLGHAILATIARQQRRKAMIRLFICSSLFLTSLIVLVPLLFSAWSDLTQSGIFQFLGLFFEHFSDVMIAGQDYFFSLLEYLPVFSIVIFLAVILVLLGSLRLLFRDLKTLFPSSHFLNH